MSRVRASSIVASSCAMQGGMQPDGSGTGQLLASQCCRAALANSLASENPPLRFEACFAGQGDIRRDVDGNLFGKASISSPSGSVSRTLVVDGESQPADEETLLTYRDFKIDADLSGRGAGDYQRRTAGEGGRSQGEERAARAQSRCSQINAHMSASLPDLAPFAVFAPQPRESSRPHGCTAA